MEAQSSISTDLIAAIRQTSEQSTEASAEGVTTAALMAMIIGAVVVLIVSIIVPIFAATKVTQTVFDMLGILLVLGGIVMLFLHFYITVPEISRHNLPVLCPRRSGFNWPWESDNTNFKTRDPFRTTLGELRQIYEDNKNSFVGYEFYPDHENWNPNGDLKGVDTRDILDEFTGAGYLIVSITDPSECPRTDTPSYTFIREQRRAWLLWAGIAMMGAGGLTILFQHTLPKRVK